MTTPTKAAWSLWQGTWQGRGTVLKRSGEVAASYLETATWEATRQTPDFVVYNVHQNTRHEVSSKPMHTETGFLKIVKDTGAAVLGLTHPFPSGMVNEISKGELQDQVLTLSSQDFQRAVASGDDAKQVTAFKRIYKLVDESKLHYDQYLKVGDGEMYHHLHCEMERKD